MKRNLIAHYSGGGSDKVYMACVRDNNDGTFAVIGKWGRRGNINQQSVKVTAHSIVEAEVAQKRLFNEKLAKGYRDVENSGYTGGVDRSQPFIVNNLEPETSSVKRAPKQPKVAVPTPVPAKPAPAPVLEDDGEVICVNNTGMEDKFDTETSYIAELHKDPTMLYVYDKFGKRGEYFKDRFVAPSKHTAPLVFKQFNAGDTIRIIGEPAKVFKHFKKWKG
jgi:predicted DNA-binding WGR domain protein